MLTFPSPLAETSGVTELEDVVRELQQELARVQARLDELVAAPPVPRQHSPEAIAWAQRHGIDLDEFVPMPDSPPGTFTVSVAEAARVLNLSQEQVRRHLRAGRLRGIALRGRAGWRVSRLDLVRFKTEREGLTIDLDTVATRPA